MMSESKLSASDFSPSIQRLFNLPFDDSCRLDSNVLPRDYRAEFGLSEQDIPELLEIAGRLDGGEEFVENYPAAPLHAWFALAQFDPAVAVPEILDLMNSIAWDWIDDGHDIRVWQVLESLISDALRRKDASSCDILVAFMNALKENRSTPTRIMLLHAVHEIRKPPKYHAEYHQFLLEDLKELRIGCRRWYAAVVQQLASGDEAAGDIQTEMIHRLKRSCWKSRIPDAKLPAEVVSLIKRACLEGYVNLPIVLSDDDFNRAVGFDPENDPELKKQLDEHLKVREILSDLKGCETFPESAIQRAREHRDIIIPGLIEIVRDATIEVRHCVGWLDRSSFFATVLLLGEFQAKEALPFIIDGLSLTEDDCCDFFGDECFELMYGVLYRLIGNDFNYYDEKLRDARTPQVLRSKLLEALPYLLQGGTLQSGEYYDLMVEYLRIAIDEQNERFTTDLLYEISHSHNPKYLPIVTEAFDKGLVDEELMERDDFDASWGVEAYPGQWAAGRHVPKDDFSKMANDMRHWDIFRPEPKKQSAPPRQAPLPPIPAVLSGKSHGAPMKPMGTTSKKVGRNDPCPCGSGKKYKKCCME
jgi:hypothetical protein